MKKLIPEMKTRIILDKALEYEVDQFDILESFICDILDISPDDLYEWLDGWKMVKELENRE